MTDRRGFLKTSALGSIGLAWPSTDLFFSDMADNPGLGIITNTVGNEMGKDYKSTLRILAEMGYKYIEGGVPEGSANQYRNLLNNLGLQSIAVGAGMDGLLEDLDNTLKTVEQLGSEYVVCYWPWLSSADNLDMDEVKQAVENINRIGEKVHNAGFRFAWHNHDKEFVNINGKTVFDFMLQNTDPSTTTVQMDWYWVVKGGRDPVDYFKRYPGRFELAHVKDMNNNKDRGITCVGNGIMDFKRLFKHAKTGGVKYFIVENERAIQGLQCAKESYEHISSVTSETF